MIITTVPNSRPDDPYAIVITATPREVWHLWHVLAAQETLSEDMMQIKEDLAQAIRTAQGDK